ncbi:MAG: hypothetical protein ACKVOY_00770 [Burkholderiaceae bacterium]
MIVTGSYRASLLNRRKLKTADGVNYFKSDFIQTDSDATLSPQVFLIEQEANSILRTHFHTENQYQVVVAGRAMLGKHSVYPISLHYASKHTGYGPIQTLDEGLSYFSIRDRTTQLAYYLPESKHLMADVPRKNIFAPHFEILPSNKLQALTDLQIIEAIEVEPDGLAAWQLRIPSDQIFDTNYLQGEFDRYVMVLSGSMHDALEWLTPWSVTYISAQEKHFPIQAGPQGLEVLIMQFPK